MRRIHASHFSSSAALPLNFNLALVTVHRPVGHPCPDRSGPHSWTCERAPVSPALGRARIRLLQHDARLARPGRAACPARFASRRLRWASWRTPKTVRFWNRDGYTLWWYCLTRASSAVGVYSASVGLIVDSFAQDPNGIGLVEGSPALRQISGIARREPRRCIGGQWPEVP